MAVIRETVLCRGYMDLIVFVTQEITSSPIITPEIRLPVWFYQVHSHSIVFTIVYQPRGLLAPSSKPVFAVKLRQKHPSCMFGAHCDPCHRDNLPRTLDPRQFYSLDFITQHREPVNTAYSPLQPYHIPYIYYITFR